MILGAAAAMLGGHRRHGCIPDAPHKRTQLNARGFLADRIAGAPVPQKASLAQFRAPILDQGPLGSCTGHGTTQGLAISYGAAGKPLPYVPSPDGIYKLTRAVGRMSDPSFPALTDSGGMPSDIFTGISRYGIRPIQAPTADGRYSDCDASTVNVEPKLIELELDGLKLVTGGHRIDETAGDMILQVQQAIASGIGLGVAFFVDTDFENWTPLRGPISRVNLSDPSGGGHWVALDSYETLNDGTVVLRGPNSWSVSWGESGEYQATDAWLRDAASDIYLFNVEGS